MKRYMSLCFFFSTVFFIGSTQAMGKASLNKGTIYRNLSANGIVQLSAEIKKRAQEVDGPSGEDIRTMMETMEKHGFLRLIDVIKTRADLDEALLYAERLDFLREFAELRIMMYREETAETIITRMKTLVGKSPLHYQVLWERAEKEDTGERKAIQKLLTLLAKESPVLRDIHYKLTELTKKHEYDQQKRETRYDDYDDSDSSDEVDSSSGSDDSY